MNKGWWEIDNMLVVRVADKDSPSYIMGNDDGTITLYDYIVQSTGIESPVHLYSIRLIAKFENYMPVGTLNLSDIDYSKDVLYEYKSAGGGFRYEYVKEKTSDGNYSVYLIEKTSDTKHVNEDKIYKIHELKADIESYNNLQQNPVCEKSDVSQEHLLELINELNEQNCIIVRSKSGEFLPALFRRGPKYVVYLHSLSQLEDYDDVTELIDEFEAYIDKEKFYEYDIVSMEEFEKLRFERIRKDVISKYEHKDDKDNFWLIMSDLKRDGGTYVISSGGEVKYLIGAVATDEDYYYAYLKSNRLEVEMEFDSCVGTYVPLHRYLPLEEYNKVKSYGIEEVLSEKNYEKTKDWVLTKIESSTDYVFFTPLCLKQKFHFSHSFFNENK